MPRPKSSSHRKVLEAVRSSIREVLGKFFMMAWLVALLGAGWLFYQRSHPAEVQPVPWIKAKSAPLIGALEGFHEQHGIYPKLLRDLASSPIKYGLNFIYNGEDPAPGGYRGYGLLVVSKGVTYSYSSSTHDWQEQGKTEVPGDMAN